MLSNQQFCYWLQGYFEIAPKPQLNEERLIKISNRLADVSEPLGAYTSWLKEVLANLAKNAYCPNLTAFFTPMITRELNFIFYHEIDNSYDTPHSAEILLKIHNGETA